MSEKCVTEIDHIKMVYDHSGGKFTFVHGIIFLVNLLQFVWNVESCFSCSQMSKLQTIIWQVTILFLKAGDITKCCSPGCSWEYS